MTQQIELQQHARSDWCAFGRKLTKGMTHVSDPDAVGAFSDGAKHFRCGPALPGASDAFAGSAPVDHAVIGCRVASCARAIYPEAEELTGVLRLRAHAGAEAFPDRSG